MRRMFGRAVLFALLLMSMVSCDFFMGLLGLNSGFAANVILVEDNISTTVIWDAAKVYYLDSSIEVSSGASLTIPAGTVVKFNVDGALLVADGATLNAVGTAEKPIVFTSIKDDSAGGDSALDGITTAAAAKDWRGTWLLTGSVASFSYCNFRYAGAGDCAALYLDGRATVSYCTFSDNDGGLPSGVGEAALDAHAAATGTIFRDDTRGGDSNADASATAPVDASWYGVYNNNTDAYYTANVFYAANY